MEDVAVLITATWFAWFSATYTRVPSGLTERPLGAGLPLKGIVAGTAAAYVPAVGSLVTNENTFTSLVPPPT